MIICRTIKTLKQCLGQLHKSNMDIGFVPTMGALHKGHISLINRSKEENGTTVCSIFVNPTQFNNPEDLKKYPITIEQDIEMLEQAKCDLLFLPDVGEIYPLGEKKEHYNLGYLEEILEGHFRPGHYQGVAMVVDKLLTLVQPNRLYLGQKDYQQVMVIQKMIDLKKHSTKIVVCPTLRENDGLAMSSRNMRLNEKQRAASVAISKVLNDIKEQINEKNVVALEKSAIKYLKENGFENVDYVSIADAHTLQPSENKNNKLVALVAAYMDDVRLIDNMPIN